MQSLSYLKLKLVNVILIGAFGLFHWPQLNANEVNASQVKQSVVQACIDYQSGKDMSVSNSCKAYIDGFIDASLVANMASIGYQSDQGGRSDIVQRAMKYRVGAWDIDGNEVSYDFCIPENVLPVKVKASIAQGINVAKLDQQPLKYAVLSTLKQLYPCQ